MDVLLNAAVLASMLRVATPLTLAALGCLLCQRAGVFNIAIEGFMLMGAFASVAAVVFSGGSVWVGMFAAMAASMLLSAVFALSVVRFKANQIISGIAINMLSLGLTTYLMRTIFDVQGSIRPEVINKLPLFKLPALEKLPLLGPALNNQSYITYASILLVVLIYVILFRSEYGLNVRSIGESEDAAKTAGIHPGKIKWSVILLSGLFSGLAGAYLSTTIVSEFSENMVQGRGFNAFTAVVFGNAHPIYVWLVTLLFGYADAVGIQIELLGTGVPPSVVKMFPYVLAILALAISSGMNKYKKRG